MIKAALRFCSRGHNLICLLNWIWLSEAFLLSLLVGRDLKRSGDSKQLLQGVCLADQERFIVEY